MKNSSHTTQNVNFKKKALRVLKELKHGMVSSAPPLVPIYDNRTFLGFLRPISTVTLEQPSEITSLARWRKMSEAWFPAQFKVTLEGTKKWAIERLIKTPDRLLFMVVTPDGTPVGHVGLFRFDYKNFMCEIDNIIRGEPLVPGIMTHAIRALMDWGEKYIGIKKYGLEVFSDNTRAIALYRRCGFKPTKQIPLKKIVEKGRINWVESPGETNLKRYNLYMSRS